MEEAYSKLKKEHGLPDFDVMDKWFEVSSIDEEDLCLRSIRKKVVEKIDFCIKLLDDMLHPDAGFGSYRESTMFTEQEREKIIDTYKLMMFFSRRATELSIEDSDQSNVVFINDFMAEWPNAKEQMLVFVGKLKDSWKKDVLKKEVVGYLG